MTDDPNNLFTTEPASTPTPVSEKRWVQYLKKPWVIVGIAIFIVLAVIGFSINQIMLTLLHSRAEVVVPKLEGKSLTDALSIVSPMDLSIQQEGTDFDESLPAGTVLRQTPPSGMQVRAGRAIRVVISKGGQVVFVPGVVGKLLAEAQSMLATDGMQMGAVSESYSNEFGKNMVLSQNPSSGTVATRGAFVDVDVSKGPAPVGLPLVPDFLGKSVDSAREWAAGVNAQVKVKEDSKAVGAAGTIVKQDPPSGQPLMEDQDMYVVAVPAGSSGRSRFSYQVPGTAANLTVRIMARNDQGETQIYEGKHNGGFVIEVPVTIKNTTRFRVYLDDVLKDEKVVEP